MKVGRPGFDDSTAGDGDQDEDAGLDGYLQESDDSSGSLTASADEGDGYKADGGEEQDR